MKKQEMPILGANLLLPNFTKNPRRSLAMLTFFALRTRKMTAPNL